jgi:hypothetical protein
MARLSLADSLMASLSKGVHVDTAEKIARGLPPIPDDIPTSNSTEVLPVNVVEPIVTPVIVNPVLIAVTEPVVTDVTIAEVTFNRKPAKQPANEPVNNRDHEPVSKTDIKPDYEPVIDPAQIPYPDNQPVSEPVKRQEQEPVRQPVNGSNSCPACHPAIYPANVVGKIVNPEIWYPYTEKQGRVLLYLIEAGGRTKREIIANDTGVNIATVKYSLRVFVKDGFISPTNLDVNHTMRGFTYALNPHLCNEYAARVIGSGYTPITNQANHPTNDPVRYPVNKPVFNPTNRPVSHPVSSPAHPFSSKVFEDENLTTSKPGLLNEPELRFWAGEGVTERQVVNWMAEFQLSEEEIVMSLRYGRFDILERGDVQNSANWFYKIMTRNGFYPRPPNYRSLLEIRAEALQQQQERDREAKAQIEEGEFETRFKAFLADPDALLYQELLDQVSSFAKEQLKEGDSRAAEIELKDLLRNA